MTQAEIEKLKMLFDIAKSMKTPCAWGRLQACCLRFSRYWCGEF